jgi:hypothetical protein
MRAVRYHTVVLVVLLTAAVAFDGGLRASPFEGFSSAPQEGAGRSLLVVVDATVSTAYALAPFVWDGSRDDAGRMQVSGSRPSTDPRSLFGEAIRNGLLPRLRNQDRLAVVVVADRVRVSEWLDAREAATLLSTLLTVEPSDRVGASPIWDATWEAILRVGPTRTGSVMLVTDGHGSGNRHSVREVTQTAIARKVAINVIHVLPALASGRAFRLADSSSNPWLIITPLVGRGATDVLEEIAGSTGGSYQRYEAGSGPELSSMMAAVMEGRAAGASACCR